MLLFQWAAFTACAISFGQTKPTTAKVEEEIEKPGDDFFIFPCCFSQITIMRFLGGTHLMTPEEFLDIVKEVGGQGDDEE